MSEKNAAAGIFFFGKKICIFKINYYLCSVIKNQNQAAGLKARTI